MPAARYRYTSDIRCGQLWPCRILRHTGRVPHMHAPIKSLPALSDIHLALERDIADFLGTESAILYSQAFSTVTSVIPAFAKRGDIIIADRGVNFAIQQGINISRCTVRWFEHNNMRSLEEVLLAVEKERKKKKWPLTRRFIITEGIFEKDGQMVDLPQLVRTE
jgi:serine palmitoyltransferase